MYIERKIINFKSLNRVKFVDATVSNINEIIGCSDYLIASKNSDGLLTERHDVINYMVKCSKDEQHSKIIYYKDEPNIPVGLIFIEHVKNSSLSKFYEGLDNFYDITIFIKCWYRNKDLLRNLCIHQDKWLVSIKEKLNPDLPILTVVPNGIGYEKILRRYFKTKILDSKDDHSIYRIFI